MLATMARAWILFSFLSMFPNLMIHNITLPLYGIMIFLGCLAGLFVALGRSRRAAIKKEDTFYAFLFGIIGLIVGGKLLYLLTISTELPALFRNAIDKFELIRVLLTGGFVFFGSLIGIFGMLVGYSWAFKIDFKKLLLAFTPAIPLAQSFGRIGCFFAGCCHGIKSEACGVYFLHSAVAPPNIKLFPVQLIEAFGTFLIFCLLHFVFRQVQDGYFLFALYIFVYAPFRFILEFWRGDDLRGSLFRLSTSQWISLLLILVVSVLWIYRSRNSIRTE